MLDRIYIYLPPELLLLRALSSAQAHLDEQALVALPHTTYHSYTTHY